MSQNLQEAPVIGNIDGFKPSKRAEFAFKMAQRLGKKKIESMSVTSLKNKLRQLADSVDPSPENIGSILDFALELDHFIKTRGSTVKNESMQFPKLQALTEAKKPKKVEDDMVLDEPTADEAPAVDKAAVLSFLKGADTKTRAAVKKQLDKLVAADEATK